MHSFQTLLADLATRVLVVPRPAGSFAFATLGMSASGDPEPLELHVLVKPAHRREARNFVVELLAAVAHYRRTEQPLSLGHTVDFGRGVASKLPLFLRPRVAALPRRAETGVDGRPSCPFFVADPAHPRGAGVQTGARP